MKNNTDEVFDKYNTYIHMNHFSAFDEIIVYICMNYGSQHLRLKWCNIFAAKQQKCSFFFKNGISYFPIKSNK